MASESVTFAEESQMLADLDPDPGAEPDYWLHNYPCLTLALADQADGMTAQDAAELLSEVVVEASGHGASGLDDDTVVGVYLGNYVLVDAA